MKYVGKPKMVLFQGIIIFLAGIILVVPAVLITFLSFDTIHGTKMFEDFMNWLADQLSEE